jgi:hypothetical protein
VLVILIEHTVNSGNCAPAARAPCSLATRQWASGSLSRAFVFIERGVRIFALFMAKNALIMVAIILMPDF